MIPMANISEFMKEYSSKVNASLAAEVKGDNETSDKLMKEVSRLWTEYLEDETLEESA